MADPVVSGVGGVLALVAKFTSWFSFFFLLACLFVCLFFLRLDLHGEFQPALKFQPGLKLQPGFSNKSS